MAHAAHNHNGCTSCHQNECNCACDTVVSREIIREQPSFRVVVNGDYVADPDDQVINVKAGALNAAGAVIVPAVTLPCPSLVDRDGAEVTIVAQGGDVRIDGLNDQAYVNVDGVPSTGARILAGGGAVTFRLSEDVGDDSSNCGCSLNYWIAECCGLTPAPATA